MTNDTENHTTLQTAIALYDKVKLTAASRLSFVQSGEHGSPHLDGETGAPSPFETPNLAEMLDVTFQRIEHVMRSLVDHSELPDQIHELQLQESLESKLAGTICTSFFLWMLADVSEHFSGGSLHTVKPMIESFIEQVGPHSTSQNTSLRNRPPTPSLRSTSTQQQPNGEVLAPAPEIHQKKKSDNGKKRTAASKTSNSKLRKGKKSPSAKKKRRKSGKRSAGKRKG